MKTKHNIRRSFRKLKCLSKFHTKCDKNFKQSVLIYIQIPTVQINLSRVGCVFVFVFFLPFGIYMCTIRLIEPTVPWQNSKPVSCKTHAFNIQALYIQKFSRIAFRC